MSSLRRGAAAILSLRVISIFAQLVVFATLAVQLPISEVGLFALASATWVLARALSPLGWDVLLLREAATLATRGDFRAVAKLTTHGSLLSAAVSFTAFVPIFAFFFPDDRTTSLIIVATAVLWGMIGPLVASLRGIGLSLIAQVYDSVGLQVLPAVVVTSLSLFGSLSLEATLLSFTISAFVAVTSCAALMLARTRGARPGDNDQAVSIKSLYPSALRLWSAQVAAAVSSRLPTLLTAPMAGLKATALVETGSKGQLVGATISWALGIIASRRYSTEADSALAQRTLSAAIGVTFLATVAFTAAVAGLGPFLLPLLGSDYLAAFVPLVLMCLAAVAESIASAAGYYFAMTRRETQNATGGVLQLVVLAGSMLALTPLYGASGTGVAVLLGSTARTAYACTALHSAGLLHVVHPTNVFRALRGR